MKIQIQAGLEVEMIIAALNQCKGHTLEDIEEKFNPTLDPEQNPKTYMFTLAPLN